MKQTNRAKKPDDEKPWLNKNTPEFTKSKECILEWRTNFRMKRNTKISKEVKNVIKMSVFAEGEEVVTIKASTFKVPRRIA